jgi:twin BRCT domain
VTQYWVEECIAKSQILHASSNVLYEPTKLSLPLPAFAKLVIGTSGFEDADRHRVKSLVQALGATFTEKFSRGNTHLICHVPLIPGAKVKKARQCGIPVAGIRWVYESLRLGCVADVADFAVGEQKAATDEALAPVIDAATILAVKEKAATQVDEFAFHERSRTQPQTQSAEMPYQFDQTTPDVINEPEYTDAEVVEVRPADFCSFPRSRNASAETKISEVEPAEVCMLNEIFKLSDLEQKFEEMDLRRSEEGARIQHLESKIEAMNFNVADMISERSEQDKKRIMELESKLEAMTLHFSALTTTMSMQALNLDLNVHLLTEEV